MRNKNPWASWVSCASLLASLQGCASFEQINACNQLAYSQAPPVYDSRYTSMLMQCPLGFGQLGHHSQMLGMAPNPLYCEQLLIKEDMNYWSRRRIFDGCMKGVTPTTPVVAPESVPGSAPEPGGT